MQSTLAIATAITFLDAIAIHRANPRIYDLPRTSRKREAEPAGVIRTWDPQGLLAGGAPIDEFDKEIASLVAQIPRIHSAVYASHAVSRIFSSSFEAESLPMEVCSEVGKRLFAALSEQGLID